MGNSLFSFLTAVVLIGLAGSVPIVAIMVARKFTRPEKAPALPADLDEIHARLDEIDMLKERLLEAEERIDFAERLLQQQQSQLRLAEPEHLTPV